MLFVDDLVTAYLGAVEHIDDAAGRDFNIGGGPEHTMSVHELLGMLERRLGRSIPFTYDRWRPGDQRVFIADIGLPGGLLKWRPSVSPDAGVGRLLEWVQSERKLLTDVLPSAGYA